jgi:mRNA interferase RelE/StbE
LKDVYTLKFLGRALQDLKKIDLPFQKIIKEKLLIFAENLAILKNNINKLTGSKEDYYRLRVGSYRIIYEKRDKELIILIIRIGYRREIYQ